MDGSKKYQIERYSSFDRSIEKIIKAHYKKNPQALKEFEDVFELLIQALTLDPFFRLTHAEPMPKGIQMIGWEFRKLYFNLPGLTRGKAAEQGRIMYLVNEEQHRVAPLILYTHDEYAKRPSDQEIRRWMQSVTS